MNNLRQYEKDERYRLERIKQDMNHLHAAMGGQLGRVDSALPQRLPGQRRQERRVACPSRPLDSRGANQMTITILWWHIPTLITAAFVVWMFLPHYTGSNWFGDIEVMFTAIFWLFAIAVAWAVAGIFFK